MEAPLSAHSRDQIIVKTGIIGILTTVVLACFKGVVGLLSNSIAIILDAVNNFSDALSSVITIIGIKLAGRAPDKEHPFGHGRIEYLAALIIAGIIFYAGVVAFVESVRKIIEPVDVNYDKITLFVLTVAIVVKIVLGKYTQKRGEEVKSDSLIASGADAKFDAIVSASVLASAIIYMISGFSLEAYLGAIIAIMLLKTAYEISKDTINKILGARPDLELSSNIYADIRSIPGVGGAYDLMFHDYGPDKMIGSVHIEVAQDMSAAQIDALTRKIRNAIFEKHKVIIDTVGIYAFNKDDKESSEIYENIRSIAFANKFVSGVHGFYFDKEQYAISCDIIVDFAAGSEKAMQEIFDQIVEQIQEIYPKFTLMITRDSDYSG